MFLKLNILTARRILPRVRSSTSRWQWRRALNAYLKSVPVFRAEKSFTSKHTTEFTGFDLEFSYIESYRDVMQIEAEILTYALGVVNEKYGERIKEAFGIELIVPTLPFPVITLAELYDALEKEYGYVPAEGGTRRFDHRGRETQL